MNQEFEFREYNVTLSGDEQAAISTIHVKPWQPEAKGYDLGQLIVRDNRSVEVMEFSHPASANVLGKMTLDRARRDMFAYVLGYPELGPLDVAALYWSQKHRDFRERERRREHKEQLRAERLHK
jgi:hypothetical protein